MNRQIRILFTLFLWAISLHLFAQEDNNTNADTTIYSYKIETLTGKKRIGFLNRHGFYLLNSRNDTLLKQPGEYFSWHFEDFDKDGYKDIYLDKGGNIPERFDLLLYTPSTKIYKKIMDFDAFPNPIKIRGTKYYYSYHKSGCADADWDSDLFYIHNFRAIRIGNISGRECGRDKKDGLYINKVRNEKKFLKKTMPVQTIAKYKDYKWGFIKEYWSKNYKLFL
jgi:hypothetical protein